MSVVRGRWGALQYVPWHLWGIIPILLLGSAIRIWPLVRIPPDLPFNGGGLYYQFTATILEGGIAYPDVIPFYTEGGIPFAYPPLAFFLTAGISTISGVSAFDLHLYLPVAFSVLALVAFVLLAREVLVDKATVVFGVMVYALSTFAFQELVLGEGMVEAMATALFIPGLILLFRIGPGTKEALLIGALFGLNVMTSLETSLAFLACSVVACLIRLEGRARWRSPLIICGVALLVSSPYWLTVLSTQGVEVFLNALSAGKGSGVQGSAGEMGITAVYGYVLAVMAAAGAVHCLYRRRFTLPLMALVVLLLPKVSYLMPVFVALLVSIFAVQALPEAVTKRYELNGTALKAGAFLIVTILAMATAAVAEGPPIEREELAFEAMDWVRGNVDNEARFVMVVDHGAEFSKVRDWFPAIAERTTLNVFYGTEWTGEYPELVRMNDQLVEAGSVEDLERVIEENGMGDFTHLFISNDPVNDDIIDELSGSPSYQMVHMNEGYLIYSRGT